jgi:hypothetical protein
MPGLQQQVPEWSVDTRAAQRFLARLLQEIQQKNMASAHTLQGMNQSLLTQAQGSSGAPQQQVQQQATQPGQANMAQQQSQPSMRPPEPTPPPQGQYPTQWRRGQV